MILDEKVLFAEALKARKNSYSPYSRFPVGAVVALKNGKFIYGTNVENAAYPSGMCAERVVLFSAYANGYKKEDIAALAVVGDTKNPISPCCGCRQVMVELLELDTPVYLFNLEGELIIYTVNDLVPYIFDKEDL